MDVLYVLGVGSKWMNNEIRFSIRSLRNFKGKGRIFIVGENPGFLKDVIHIQHPDELGSGNADGNIIRKVLRACKTDITDDFLFINDDHFILKEIETVPNLHRGDMNTYRDSYFNNNHWRTRLKRTRDNLNAAGLTCFNYDIHTPIIMNKHKFPEVVAKFDYATFPGLTMKSLYGNSVVTDGYKFTFEKVKIFQHKSYDQLMRQTQNCMFASVNDQGMNAAVRMWIYDKFPEPSEYEADDYHDRLIVVREWQRNGSKFSPGVDLLLKYFPDHLQLARQCRRSKTPRNEFRLRKTLLTTLI